MSKVQGPRPTRRSWRARNTCDVSSLLISFDGFLVTPMSERSAKVELKEVRKWNFELQSV